MKNFFAEKLRPTRIKTPTILQMEASECGAASLSIILAYWGLWIPLEKMREECGVNRDGVSAKNIVRAARLHDCNAIGYRWPADKLKNAQFPLLIHWEFNHFIVLEGIHNNKVYLNDPAIGHRTISFDDFRSSYTGIALKITPSEKFKKAGKKYSITKTISHKILKDKWALTFIILVCACLVIPGLATPVFNEIFLDDILTGNHPDWIFNLVIAMIVTFLVESILVWLRSWCLTKWQTKLVLADSAKFFWHVLQLPMKFFQQRYGAEVASRVAFADSIASVLTGSAATAVLDFFVALFYLLLLFQYNITLTVIGLTFSLISVTVFMVIRAKMLEMSMKVQQDAGKEYGVVMNGLLMIETLKANGNEEEFFSKWSGYRTKILTGTQKITLYSTTMQMLPLLLSGINTALIMTVGGFAIMDGLMTAGIFVAFQGLMSNFQTPFNKLLGLADQLQTTEMQMKRMDDVLQYERDYLNYPKEKQKSIGRARLHGKISLNNICFGYSPLEDPLFKDFNMKVEPGQWIALVGGSGCGKSTIAKIINGLYQEWSGDILFDDLPRSQIPREVIYNSVASVDQDIFLLSGTVEDNITLFDDSIRHSDVIKAAQDACIHEDILKMNGGYNAQVAEGGLNFSGGQRQRLEIARALSQNPSILILDEATSALDPLTEQQIMNNIRRRGCTCIIVAHRLSTIRDCDEIIVIDHGNILERGSHKQLMSAQGYYYKLIDDQGDSALKDGKA